MTAHTVTYDLRTATATYPDGSTQHIGGGVVGYARFCHWAATNGLTLKLKKSRAPAKAKRKSA